MKNFLVALIIFITPVKAFALQDYMIFSEKQVIKIFVENKNIVDIIPIQTIDNNKQTIILKAKQEGKTSINIKTIDGDNVIEIKVKTDDTVIKDKKGFEYVPIDLPPENLMIDGFEILPPPKIKGGK